MITPSERLVEIITTENFSVKNPDIALLERLQTVARKEVLVSHLSSIKIEGLNLTEWALLHNHGPLLQVLFKKGCYQPLSGEFASRFKAHKIDNDLKKNGITLTAKEAEVLDTQTEAYFTLINSCFSKKLTDQFYDRTHLGSTQLDVGVLSLQGRRANYQLDSYEATLVLRTTENRVVILGLILIPFNELQLPARCD